jgi:hypothetical protein
MPNIGPRNRKKKILFIPGKPSSEAAGRGGKKWDENPIGHRGTMAVQP